MEANTVNGATDHAEIGEPYYFTLGEETANVLTHAVGFVISLLLMPLFIYSSLEQPLGLRFMCLLFVSSMAAVYWCSTLSHVYQDAAHRNRMRAWDQGVIYLLIVGTYSPFIWQGSTGWQRVAFLTAVWLIAISGFAAKVIARYRINAISTVTYLALGWLPALPLIKTTPPICFKWMFWGGVSYTLGTVFLLLTRFVRYSHAAWHVMVLLGSACHCVAVLHLLRLA